jgi:large subunit ribosomal protein L24
MLKTHQKPHPQLQQPGGIGEKDAGIQVSNVAIWNPKTEKADRVGFKVEGETKVRVFKSTGEVIA